MKVERVTCPKCGSRSGWDGPRYIARIPGDPLGLDGLSFTCLDCRFTRYEPTLDRQSDTDSTYRHEHGSAARGRWLSGETSI